MNWILFDDCRSVPARGVLFDQPVEWVTCTRAGEVGKCLARVERALREGLHVAGAFAYELGYALEEKLASRAWDASPTPLISLGLFERRRDLTTADLDQFLSSAQLPPSGSSLRSEPPPPRSAGEENPPFPPPRLAGEVVSSGARNRRGEVATPSATVTPRWEFSRYASAFARVHDYISAGDVYQVNLTFPLDVEISGDLIALYRDLRRNARSGYGALMAMPDATILSLSPELFFEIEGGLIRTRPMKGTVARAPTYAQDRQVAASLAQDEKQCAENLMIVDLLRNDLSRIAERGSVEVEDLFTVETYPTLHTMTSGIRAALRPGVTIADILRAVFPCGSVTGAPKIRAMEIIRELETSPRGVYCGALGWFSGESARLNVAIRTLEIRDGKARLNVGGGLVYDSGPQAEYDEALLKARFLTDPAPPFSLIETMRLDRGGIWLLDRHLSRLRESAAYFQFPYDETAVRAALATAVESPDALTRSPPPLTPPRKGEGNVDRIAKQSSDHTSASTPNHRAQNQNSPPPRGEGLGAGGSALARQKTSDDEDTAAHAIESDAPVHRLRLLLNNDGSFDITATRIAAKPLVSTIDHQAAPQLEEMTVAISPIRTNSADRYLHHKTTRRELYDREFDRVSNLGFGEMIFLNEQGELTEGSRTTLFIAKDGLLLTPPLSSGVLAGCLRAELIARASPAIIEQVLTETDLATADAIYLGNSVRGLMRARIIGS